MKTYEVEIKRVSYIITRMEADDEQQAVEEAIRWYESVSYTEDCSLEIESVREINA